MANKAGFIIENDGQYLCEIPYGYDIHKQHCLDFPKGHIEDNETPIHAAIRELREETGIHIEIENGTDTYKFGSVPTIIVENSDTGKNTYWWYGFTANDNLILEDLCCESTFSVDNIWDLDDVYIDLPEVSGYVWINKADLEKMLQEDVYKSIQGVL
jgi:8-oxo-dGTP pyrophosphatase MutT (NUDIX family)